MGMSFRLGMLSKGRRNEFISGTSTEEPIRIKLCFCLSKITYANPLPAIEVKKNIKVEI